MGDIIRFPFISRFCCSLFYVILKAYFFIDTKIPSSVQRYTGGKYNNYYVRETDED